MSIVTRLALASALVTAAASSALAQPAMTPPGDAPPPAAPPAAAAPQNVDWSAVSHLNGQLVPVGEKNSYLYAFKRTIISTDPVGWIFGMYGISGSYALDDHLAIRAELDYYAPPNTSSSEDMFEADLGVPIYLRRTYQGAFLEPGLVYRRFRSQDSGGITYDGAGNPVDAPPTRVTGDQFGPQVLVGWHWTWESGLNVAVAAGVGRNLDYVASSSSYVPNNDQYIPNGYVRFGYAF